MKNVELHQLLETIIRRVLQEEGLTTSVDEMRRLYIISYDTWNYRYDRLGEECKRLHNSLHNIVLGTITEDYRNHLQKMGDFISIREWNHTHPLQESDCVVIPYMERNDVIEIAQGYAKSPMGQIVRNAFEVGAKVYLLPYALEKLTGREPKGYQSKILACHEELFQLGIEFLPEVDQLSM